jgi:type IX secretion system PorP/SprF family membrane protein
MQLKFEKKYYKIENFCSKNRASLIFFVLICAVIGEVKSQFDPHFSQYVLNPVAYNPGYAGMNGQISVLLIERQQWMKIEGHPKTTVVGADMAVNFFGNPGGVGLMFLNDRIGYYNNLFIQGFVSQKFDLGEGKLGIGINFGLINMVLDGTKLKPNPYDGGDYHQSTDPLVPAVEVNGTAFDLSIGTYYKTPKYFAGISILHLFRPKPNFKDEFSIYIPRSFFFSAGYNYSLWEKPIILKPSFMIKKSEALWQYELNFIVMHKERFWGGLTYRYQDAVVVLLGLELLNGLKFGYSYDISISAVARRSNGSHEINIGYLFDLDIGKRNNRYKNVRFL